MFDSIEAFVDVDARVSQILKMPQKIKYWPTSACLGFKVLSVHYWRARIQSRIICTKLKFYKLNHSFWFQNGQEHKNRTINKKVLLNQHLSIFGILNIISKLFIKVCQFWSDFDEFAYFGIKSNGLINRILILSLSDSLEISASKVTFCLLG